MKKLLILILAIYGYSCYGQIIPPYVNHFDNEADTVGWSHYALSGTDDWELGITSFNYFGESHSSPNSWVTTLDGSFPANSNRVLESPYFDLTDTSIAPVLSFYQKRYSSFSSTEYFLEYTIDQGSTWQLLNSLTPKRANWQNAGGFPGNAFNTFVYSALTLGFLQDQDSVKFRFRLNNAASSTGGWMLDDFSITDEFYNISANRGDSILGITNNFENITVHSIFGFDNPYPEINYQFQSDFYLSTDTILDVDDTFLGSVDNSFNSTDPNWTNTFNIPAGLFVQTYYVIYELDKLNTMEEAIEDDNISYAVLTVDSLYETPYVEDFENIAQKWNTDLNSDPSNWQRGIPNWFHIEEPRSGKNAWYNDIPLPENSNYLESPYLNLTGSTNTVFCMWYRKSNMSPDNPSLRFQVSIVGLSNTYPFFSNASYTLIPRGRVYTWDCYCEKITEHDGENNVKIRFKEAAYVPIMRKTVIDDIYIGEARPDAAIESFKKDRFTSSELPADTLHYLFFNSGLADLPVTTTDFYWSNDSIFDDQDIFLGSKLEPTMADTTFQWSSFVYTKPTLATGEYYIFYKADSNDEVVEMREYDNLGYFEIVQQNLQSLPYFNDFESSISGWSNRSTLGTEQWEWKMPQGTFQDTPFSDTKAFIIGDTAAISSDSRVHLFTPQFDLSELQKPVMEFDLIADIYGGTGSTFELHSGNIMYSINGGGTWELLDTTNISFNRMYYPTKYGSVTGEDYIDDSFLSHILYGRNLPSFRTLPEYQGRDFENNQHYVVDLSFLQTAKQVKFMFAYAHMNEASAEIMIDNFGIREGEIDLITSTKKKLMVSSSDQKIKQDFTVKNANNYYSMPTTIKLYCSIDTILDEVDVTLGSVGIEQLRPYESTPIHIDLSTPDAYSNYKYLIIEIDPLNLNVESDDLNNVSFLELNMDTAATYNYPMLFDFNEDEVNGWTWYHDSIGYHFGHRLRHKLVFHDPTENTQSGEWFLDRIYRNYAGDFISQYPNYYLETPPFDFSTVTNIDLTFDFVCVGKNLVYSGEGGNMQYTSDGGASWHVLTTAQDPNAENWYNLDSIASLGGQPGWGEWGYWTTAKYDLSFLSGTTSVRFRYRFRSTKISEQYPNHGFRLDNFEVNAYSTTDLPQIDELSEKFGVQIYPNPNNGRFIVEKPADLNKRIDLKIFDVTSKVIFESTISNVNNKFEIDISEYSKGIYFMHLTIDDQIFIKKIIKN